MDRPHKDINTDPKFSIIKLQIIFISIASNQPNVQYYPVENPFDQKSKVTKA